MPLASPNSTVATNSVAQSLPAPSTAGSAGGEQPAFKRRRIAVACTSCRHRKTRCDGTRPSCAFCADGGLQCVYEEPLQKDSQKKVQNDYGERLRAIEYTLRQLVQNQETVQGAPMRRRPCTAWEAHDTSQEVFLGPTNEAQAKDTEVDTVDGLAAMHCGDTDTRFFGPSSNISFLRIVSRATSAALRTVGPSHRLNQSMTEESITRLQSPITSTAPSTPDSPASISLQVLPVESRAVCLIKLYFSDTGPMFPFISEKQVLASYYAYKDKQFSGLRHSLLCLFNAIFAFATYISAKPEQAITKCATEADVFFNRALALRASGARQSNDLEEIQSLLLLSLYCQGTQRPEEARTLHGLAVQAGLRLGLHSPSRLNQSQGLEREIRKRLWFGCFVMDRALSMTLGRPPIIQNEHMNLELPLDASLDGPSHTANQAGEYSESGQTNTTCFFIATLKLYEIMGTVVTKLYGQNLDEEIAENTAARMQDLFLIEEDLSSWKMSLPEKLRLRPWENFGLSEWSQPHCHPVFARLSVVTQLRYLNVRILLHRPVLSHLLWSKRTPSWERNREKTFTEQTWNLSVVICQDSAVQIIDIIHRVTESMDLLGAWWYSVYFTFNAALVIFSRILLLLDTHNSASSRATDPQADPKLVSELATRLTRAIEATERIGKDAKPARRVLAILAKLVRICLILGKYDPKNELSILSTLCARSSPNPLDASTSLGSGEGVAVGIPFSPQEPLAPAPTHMFDPLENLSQWWAAGNLEELGDIIGVDPGLVSLMTM